MNFVRRWAEKNKRARRLLHADRLREEGELSAALAEYERALREEPGNVRLLRTVAELRALTGQTEPAVEALCALIERDLDEMAFIGNTAFDPIRSLPLFRPVFERIVERLRAYLDAHPDDIPSRFRLAEVFEMGGDSSRAFAVYDELAENDDASVRGRAFYAKARLAVAANDLPTAAALLRAAFETNPNLLSVYDDDVAFDAKRAEPPLRDAREEGIERLYESLRTAVENHPHHPLFSRQLLELMMARGQYEEALALARQASERMPNEAAFGEYLARALFAAGRDDEAFDAYQDLLRQNPRHLEALYHTGLLYERRNQRTAAREAYADALREVRAEPEMALALARGFARLNDPDAALDALSQALELSLQSESMTPHALLEAIEHADDWGILAETTAFQSLVATLRAHTQPDVSELLESP